MTREEAAKIIKDYEVNGCGYCHQGGDEVEEAIDMAIQALEQEPCEYKPFVINIDKLKDEDMQKLLREFKNQQILVADHDCLPSVTIIKSCDNAISRNDMLDAIGHGTTYTSEELQKIINGLPEVKAERIEK